jgi:hypothetical protein
MRFATYFVEPTSAFGMLAVMFEGGRFACKELVDGEDVKSVEPHKNSGAFRVDLEIGSKKASDLNKRCQNMFSKRYPTITLYQYYMKLMLCYFKSFYYLGSRSSVFDPPLIGLLKQADLHSALCLPRYP